MSFGRVLRHHRDWVRNKKEKSPKLCEERLERKREILKDGHGKVCNVIDCNTMMHYYQGVAIGDEHTDASTVEHRLPHALGGVNDDWNLQSRCNCCNRSLGKMLNEMIRKCGSIYNIPGKEREDFIRFHWDPTPEKNPTLWSIFEEKRSILESNRKSGSQPPQPINLVSGSKNLADSLISGVSKESKGVKT